MTITAKDILEWCFVVGALDFGVFGFLYTTYATASFQGPIRPPITAYLRRFCRAVALVLAVLTMLAVYTGYQEGVVPAVWIIIACFILLACFSIGLAWRME